MSNLFKHSLEINPRQTMFNITSYIKEDIKASNIKNGIVVVYCPHTTAGITINENADPDVVTDLMFTHLLMLTISILKVTHIHI